MPIGGSVSVMAGRGNGIAARRRSRVPPERALRLRASRRHPAAGRSRAGTDAAPARRASRGRRASRSRRPPPRAGAGFRGGLYTRSYTSRPSNRACGQGVSSTCGAVPTGVALTSKSQLPDRGGQSDASTPSESAMSSACSRRRACTVTRAPSRPSARAAARAAPPPPSTAARDAAERQLRSQRRQQTVHVRVRPRHSCPSRTSVFSAPTARASSSSATWSRTTS